MIFFKKANSRINEYTPTDIHSFKKLFNHPTGVVISTCHGVKGEEYDTVIVFGLLNGYIPNWDEIINNSQVIAEDRASKLLYVICSRAKKRLYLISESGRKTNKQKPYDTTVQLKSLNFEYDSCLG